MERDPLSEPVRQQRSVSQRAGSTASTGLWPGRVRGTGAWALRILPITLVLPIAVSLAGGQPRQALSGVVAVALLLAASGLMRRGLAQAAAYEARSIAKAPRPLKTIASLGVAASAFVFAQWGTDGGLFGLGSGAGVLESGLFGLLGFIGSWLAYGPDPRRDKGVAAELAARSGLRTETVIAAIAEAEAKLDDIESAGAGLHSVELKARLRRIVDQGRLILQQLEHDPRDLSRARRFLVTYLDGTRDVVRKYVAQQRDVAETPLGESFRRVLTTIEQVFLEQEEVLKRHDALDLDVQIEVLETQLKREGVV
jgi:hypothetical protein